MNRRVRSVVAVGATLALGLAASIATQSAEAHWSFHNSSLGEKVTAPAGGTLAQTCSDRITAVTGISVWIDVQGGVDPATFEAPDWAKTSTEYGVWKAPAGFTSFHEAEQDHDTGMVTFWRDGAPYPATLVTSLTTPERTALSNPEPISGNPERSGPFVVTSAPISARLAGIVSGDVLGLAPVGGPPGFITLTAMSCKLPVLAAKVDVIPGKSGNVTHPYAADELIPVRIYGSKRLRVSKITGVHLGEAKPASVPADLKKSLRLKDVNHDGRADRLYYFRTGLTDIRCYDSTVRVTGRTSDKLRFQAKASIATADCG